MRISSLSGLLTVVLSATAALPAAGSPKVGDVAPAFTLSSLDGGQVPLADLTAKNSVILVVLRGWPGYQCPICDRQVNDFITAAGAFAEARTTVVFVYPGPADELKARAAEFKTWKGREWPKDFLYLLDPDYAFTNAYGLRWEAPKETAYPSTFIIDGRGLVRFAKVSHSHGDRPKAAEIVVELQKISGP